MSAIRRIGGFFLFRFVPLLLIIGIGVIGFGVLQDFLRVQNDRALIEGRSEAYEQTATAIAVEGDAYRIPLDQQWVSMGDFDMAQFATDTPAPQASATPAPTEESVPVDTPVPTQVIPTLPPQPLPTILYLPEPSDSEIQAAPTAIPTAFPIIPRDYDLVNILLMGQDNEITGENLARTDTMIVVSINRDTGTVSMLNFPRDLFVYMPQAGMQRLNVAYAVGDSLGWDGGAFFYMRQVLLYNFGINVHYFAMVDLSGFAEIIDMVDSIEVAVDCEIRDYALIGAEVPAAAEAVDDEGLYRLPVGYYEFTGKEALWYARSRGNSDDFDRGRRQQQILRAGLSAAKNSGLINDLINLPGLIQQGLEIVDTDMGVQDILGLLPTALTIDTDDIESFRFIRWYHTTPWQPPDGQNVQLPNPDEVYQLMVDFYTPPSPNQLALRDASIKVVNGTGNPDWDKVAVQRLAWSNIGSVAAGAADNADYPTTVVIDYTGSSKGSSLAPIVDALNITQANVIVEADAEREYDYEVIVGDDYNSCTGFVIEAE